MVSVTALGLRRFTMRLPQQRRAALGALCFAIGGWLIAATIGQSPNYVTGVLPGWLVVGAGVGLTMPTVVQAATSVLAPHQTSTGSAVVQMSRQIGSVLGVAGLVVILGDAGSPSALHDRFRTAMWVGGAVAVLSAAAALRLQSPRSEEKTTSRSSWPVSSGR
jgi:MFS family permease